MTEQEYKNIVGTLREIKILDNNYKLVDENTHIQIETIDNQKFVFNKDSFFNFNECFAMVSSEEYITIGGSPTFNAVFIPASSIIRIVYLTDKSEEIDDFKKQMQEIISGDDTVHEF